MLVRPYLEGYDEDDPRTWPEGPARDEALELKAWVEFDENDPDTWPEGTEKDEAVKLLKEYWELDAWFDAQDIETVKNDVEHNDRQNEVEARLDELTRMMKRRMPKRAEQKLAAILEAEAREAEREFELYEELGEPEQQVA